MIYDCADFSCQEIVESRSEAYDDSKSELATIREAFTENK